MNRTSPTRTGLLLAIVGAGLLPVVGGCGESRPSKPGGSIDAGAPASKNAVTTAPGVDRDARPSTAKPAPPIALEFVVESPSAVDAPARLLLAVTPSIDLPDCVLTVHLPEGLALAEGSLSWRGAIGRNQRQTLSLAVRVPDGQRHEIIATARNAFDGGTVLARSATLVLNAGAASAKPTAPQGVLKTNSRGEPIRELPGDDAK